MTDPMKMPRLFAPSADRQLDPQRLGLKRHQTLVRNVIAKKGDTCAFTSLKAPVRPSLPDGGMRLEVINPKGPTGKISNVRLVDPMVYWSRHVEAALEAGEGELIFAPWFTQGQIIQIVRAAMVANHFAIKSNEQAHKQMANTILEHLRPLANHEIMVQALGLDGYVDGWKPQQWIQSLRQAPPRERKQYVKALVKNIRFLPSETRHKDWIAHLADTNYHPDDQGVHYWLRESVRLTSAENG